MSERYKYGRFQLCWYGWGAETWRRCFFDRFEGGMRYVYRWRLAIGPLDIRRWRANDEREAMFAAHKATS